MKIKELRLNHEVTIKKDIYRYKGVNKVRISGVGWSQHIVFENKINPKEKITLKLHEGNRELIVKGESIELKM